MGNITLTINGVPVSGRQGMTILEVARENGIDIPTLCYLENMPPVGACRLCVVEVEGSRTLVGSCHTPITEGMVVHTRSENVLKARQDILLWSNRALPISIQSTKKKAVSEIFSCASHPPHIFMMRQASL